MNWSGNIGVGGMDRNNFVQQATTGQMEGVTDTRENSFSISSSNMFSKKISVKEFGQEKIDSIVVGNEDLIFNGTTVKLAKTRGSIVLKNGAKIENANADRNIHAENCESLGTLNAGKAIRLSNCSAVGSVSGSDIIAENCEYVNILISAGNIKLVNCKFSSANAHGGVTANNCKEFGVISATYTVKIKNSVGDKVFSCCSGVFIRQTTIKEILESSGDSTIFDSVVQSMKVRPHYVISGINVIAGRIIESTTSFEVPKIHLKNTKVKDIALHLWIPNKDKFLLEGNCEVPI